MRGVVFALAVAATLALVATEAWPGDDDESAIVNEEWLSSDIANAKKTLPLLPPKDVTVDAFLERLDASDVDDDRKTGFGGRRLNAADFGGYTSSWIKIAGFEGRLVAIEIRVRGSGGSWPDISERLKAAWGKRFTSIERGLRYRWEDAPGLAKHRAAVEKALGKAPEAEIPKDLAAAFALLTSPYERLDVGDVCYEGGDAPEGKTATDRIVAAGRYDVLRRVLRGPNPDGRVYAARALLARARKGQPLAPTDKRAIDVIRGSDVPISACSGCEVFDAKAAELLQ